MITVSLVSTTHASLLKIEEGHGRFEMLAGNSSPSIGIDRKDDFYGSMTLAYHWPIFSYVAMEMRLLPVFVYRDSDENIIHGIGIGNVIQVYTHTKQHTGVYCELALAGLWTSSRFQGNSARLNLYSELGLGYALISTPLHIIIKIQHISNANTSEENDGLNGIVVGCGYHFKSK